LRRVTVALTWKGFGRDLKWQQEEEIEAVRAEVEKMRKSDGKEMLCTVERAGVVQEEMPEEEYESEEDEDESDEIEDEGSQSHVKKSIADDRSGTLAAESDGDLMDISEG
jgi:PHD/YefM family antitoxin component YafN of YafNO toxin-antitoxin module